jgi:hypothetical protein
MEDKDLKLWEIAQKRAAFKKHLFTYAVVIAFLWLVWLFTRIQYNVYGVWPVYPTLGWGIGLAFNYFNAYHWNRKKIVEQEYKKLLEEEKQ